MDSECNSSSLSLELRFIRARNICVNTSREEVFMFVRCYLSTSSNKRVRIDSQEIPSSNSNNLINQTFSLNCCGNQETIKSLKQRTIVFELRSRSRAPNFLARMGGSKLLARAEMPWYDVVGKDEEKWVVMIAKNRHVYGDDVKPPAVKIAMKVEEFTYFISSNFFDSSQSPLVCSHESQFLLLTVEWSLEMILCRARTEILRVLLIISSPLLDIFHGFDVEGEFQQGRELKRKAKGIGCEN